MVSEDKPEAAIAERHLARLRAARPSGGPAVGYVCSYVPEEIPLAAGLRPVRLGARPGVTGLADGVLQSFACAFARALLDDLLGGSAEGLSAVVFAYTCDSLRAVFEIWRNRVPSGSRVHFLNLPCRLTGPGVRGYTASEFRRLAEALGHLPGASAVTPERLAGASATLAVFDGVVRRLDDLRRRRPDLLPGSAFLAVSREALSLDREVATQLLDALAREIEMVAAQPPPSRPDRVRVVVSGGFLETEDVLRLIEESGADVVGDDLCLGGRGRAWAGSLSGRGAPAGPVGSGPSDRGGADSEDGAFLVLADRYLGRVNCPCKHPPEGRFEAVERLAAESGADGVVFLLQKFCDSHAFDFPDLRRRLESSGRPVLLLEVERGVVPEGQARTRLEAFIERLGGVRA